MSGIQTLLASVIVRYRILSKNIIPIFFGLGIGKVQKRHFKVSLREGCTNENPEKVWSFAKPPPDPPRPPPRFGIFMKNIKFQCVFWPFLGHF